MPNKGYSFKAYSHGYGMSPAIAYKGYAQLSKNFWGRKSLLVHEILFLRRASNSIINTVTLRVQILKEKFSHSLGLPS
ncbi:hypothetical protein NIES4075_73210 [Tolypothrix sp. NIES-4075]|nr:hypothetical protein NIES4075_73210 [Tolypothrix sp. NIES-4075]